jgi:NAD(P)-dependent dehydrogenase (short-subunit alcohol dehydrogenase family)
MAWSIVDVSEQRGRVAVVTGANGGLGLATATALAGKGAHVVMAARNQAKAASARDRIRAKHPGASLEIVELDLASLASVERAAREILEANPAIHMLINNAGVMALPEGRTADGFETQLGVNHLGHWALTARLLPALVGTPDSRVVTVTSLAQREGRPLDPDDPNLSRGYGAWRAYANSKLANRHFAQGLDRQFRAAAVPAMALTADPGFSDSDLQSTTVAAGAGGGRARLFQAVTPRMGMSTERGALMLLRAATDPHAVGGDVYRPRWAISGPPVRRRLDRPDPGEAIRVLWQVSRRLTGLDVDVARAVADAAKSRRP